MASLPPPGHWTRLSLALRSQLSSSSPDLWFVSNEGYCLPVHASLLALHSPLVKDLLSSISMSTTTSMSTTNFISLPVPALPIRLLLHLLSHGVVSDHELFNPLEVLEVAEILGIDIDIHVENQNRNLDVEETPSLENVDQNMSDREQGGKIVPDGTKPTLEVGGKDGTIRCNLCTSTFSSTANLRRHIGMNHSANVSLFRCASPGCSFSTKQKARLKGHKATKHNGVRFNCADCQFQTAWREALGKHIEAKHNKVGFPWPCDLCTFKGLDEAELKSHTKMKHILH